MFEKTEDCGILKAEPQPREEKTCRNLHPIIDDITQKFLNDFEAHEQREILLTVKNNLSKHYEELRQNHLRGAEEYGKRIECLRD